MSEEKKEKIEFMQKYFVKSFWISFILLIIASFLCITAPVHNYQLDIVQKYFHLTARDLDLLVVFILGIWKVIIIQFTLIPALAIWAIKRHCCKSHE